MQRVVFCLLIIVFIERPSFSQVPVSNGYIANSYIDKFQGSWLWSSGNDSVKIRIMKMAMKLARPENSYREVLLGCHTYILNGTIRESSMEKYDSLINFNKKELNTILLYHIEGRDTSIAEGGMRDITKQKNIDIKIEYLGGNPAQIRLRLSVGGIKFTYPGDPSPPSSGITLPSDIILIKQ